MGTMQWHVFKQLPIGKTRYKYYLLFCIHRNEIGHLTPFSKINNKRVDLNKVRGGEKNLKVNKRLSSCIKQPGIAHKISVANSIFHVN